MAAKMLTVIESCLSVASSANVVNLNLHNGENQQGAGVEVVFGESVPFGEVYCRASSAS
jgi:hypothetical protein